MIGGRGLTEDLVGDEESGFDDVIYPADHKVRGESDSHLKLVEVRAALTR
jgi:hypothetical protein